MHVNRAICREPGVVYVLAPVASSMGATLLKQGFTQADLGPFKLFDAADLAAVAISRGDDFTRWEIVPIPRPPELRIRFPETTLLEFGNRWVAFWRPREALTGLVSESRDLGRTCPPLRLSNYPLFDSKPLAGRLSTGQQFLITNHLEQERTLLTIAVTAPGVVDLL